MPLVQHQEGHQCRGITISLRPGQSGTLTWSYQQRQGEMFYSRASYQDIREAKLNSRTWRRGSGSPIPGSKELWTLHLTHLTLWTMKRQDTLSHKEPQQMWRGPNTQCLLKKEKKIYPGYHTSYLIRGWSRPVQHNELLYAIHPERLSQKGDRGRICSKPYLEHYHHGSLLLGSLENKYSQARGSSSCL